jgi:hypothetical protein
MRQFISGSDAAFDHLSAQARQACVVFYDEEMPAGVVPPRARVGFEERSDGSVMLFVDRGVTYHGPNRSIREWLDAGEKRFASFNDLRAWLLDELAPSYDSAVASNTEMPESLSVPPRADQLTDLAEVHQSVQNSRRAPLDENALFFALTAHVKGQDEALSRLTRIVSRHVSRSQPRRPATVFAIGPTGVGKTKTAEALPHVLNDLYGNGNSYRYVRLDMNEYQESHRVSQLLGAPQGYIGYGDGSELLDTLSAEPKTVVLFDEIEKAHPNILRTLMNAMDAGRLSTPARAAQAGRVIDCRQAIFLFTSNLESAGILRELEIGDCFADPTAVDAICRRNLRAAGIASELAGRIGAFLVFRPLRPETRIEIVTIAVARIAEEYGVTVARIEPSVIAYLLSQADGGDFGARPDERLVDDLLGDAFVQAAYAYPSIPVMVCGDEPPFACTPIISAPQPAA